MEIVISNELDFLCATATGEYSLEAAKRTFLEILDAVVVHHSSRILFDGRELTGKPTMIERLYYSDFAAREVRNLVRRMAHEAHPQGYRFAYVLREPILDPRRFGENVAVNRGMWVRTFTEFDTAAAWLIAKGC